MTRMSPARLASGVLAVLSLACGVFAVASFLYYWDPTRIHWKRWTASDPYLYDEIDPRLRATDPATLITIAGEADVGAARDRLIAAIWDGSGFPHAALPDEAVQVFPGPSADASADCDTVLVEVKAGRRCLTAIYGGFDNLARIERLRITLPIGYVAFPGFFRPKAGNGRVVIYHHGYAGTYHDQARLIAALVSEGYAVLAFNLPGYGHYQAPRELFRDPPVRMYVEPVVAGINHLRKDHPEAAIDMVGFSAGGWVTVAAAAVDPRIRRSFPVAGVLPAYLRRARETAPPQLNPTLLAAGGYLDMFVLGALGDGRRQLQIFNRYDRCCFAGERATLYDHAVRDAVSQLGAGSFAVMIDETHASHRLSHHAISRILEEMARP